MGIKPTRSIQSVIKNEPPNEKWSSRALMRDLDTTVLSRSVSRVGREWIAPVKSHTPKERGGL
ncbi:hypothetical protein [Rhodohalobacter sulfatireducens]|uniref:Transposase n=1 Tax=Rhodohalobacter sulfatireducens TaxID=2911366 RepID=A0ABS9KJR7_9BACT|nr:hypothetical protein [Rhodohalobacter sulfatireducens]MCG2591100.1 hypothetical protein [Rhodohalobacter sulfatireducens]